MASGLWINAVPCLDECLLKIHQPMDRRCLRPAWWVTPWYQTGRINMPNHVGIQDTFHLPCRWAVGDSWDGRRTSLLYAAVTSKCIRLVRLIRLLENQWPTVYAGRYGNSIKFLTFAWLKKRIIWIKDPWPSNLWWPVFRSITKITKRVLVRATGINLRAKTGPWEYWDSTFWKTFHSLQPYSSGQ